ALQFRERAVALADKAFKNLGDILDDPSSSPSVRLKASIFVIQTATTPPPYDPKKPFGLLDLPYDIAFRIMKSCRKHQAEAEAAEKQEEPPHSPAGPDAVNHAAALPQQEPLCRTRPKTGR